jgi:hypothetical protein
MRGTAGERPAVSDLIMPQAKAVHVPEARRRNKPRYILFALGGLCPELPKVASGFSPY